MSSSQDHHSAKLKVGIIMGYEAFKKTAQYKNHENIAGLDPDKQVQDALQLFFETFRRVGSACAVVKTPR